MCMKRKNLRVSIKVWDPSNNSVIDSIISSDLKEIKAFNKRMKYRF